MRRQLSDSAVISTGRPARVYCQVMSWLRVGPTRTLTFSGLWLNNRGIGNPLDEPAAVSPAALAAANEAISVSAVASARRRLRATIREIRLEFITLRPTPPALVLPRPSVRRAKSRERACGFAWASVDQDGLRRTERLAEATRRCRTATLGGYNRPPWPAAKPAAGGPAMAKARKPLVVVTRKLPEWVETRMRELFDTRLNLDDKPMSQAELAEAAKTADVLVPTVTGP